MALYREYGERVPARVPRRPAGALGGGRRAADGGPGGRGGARPVALPAAGGAAGRAALQGLPARRAGVAVRRPADVRVARADRDRRAALPGHAARGRAGVAVRLRAAGARAGRRRRDPRPLPRGLRARLGRRGRAGRLQRADHRRRARLARGDDAARGRALPAPGRDPVQRPLHGGDAARRIRAWPRRWSSCSTRASIPTRRPRRRGRRGGRDRGARSTRSTRSTRTGSCAASSRSCRRCCAPTTTCDEAVRVVQARPDAGPADAAAAAALRDLRALAAGRGRAPARRLGRARRPALVGPARGLPHRDPRPDEGADGQERR